MKRKEFQIKCRKLVNKLSKKYFPELKEKRIFVFVPFFFRKNYSGLSVFFPPLPRMLFINKKTSSESNSFLRGLIAHELGHQSLYLSRTLKANLRIALLYWFNAQIRRKEEERVNKLIIKKGFARDIYEATKKTEIKKRKSNIQKYYMSSKDIKR
jgi:predicted SprT family Zn-dependent metalloprotease